MTQSDKDLLLQDLSARLPYKMKFISGRCLCEMTMISAHLSKVVGKVLFISESDKTEEDKAYKIGYSSDVLVDKIKPILFPLSDITETLHFGGKEVCLMDQFACIFNFDGYQGYYTTWELDEKKENVTFFTWGGEICRMNLKTFMVTPLKDTQNSTVLGLNHFQEVFSLFNRYHIDYRGLIEKGLAVSVHSLEENPYV